METNRIWLHSRYRVSDPVLVTATVRKQDVVAVKLDRQEEEIITFKAQASQRSLSIRSAAR